MLVPGDELLHQPVENINWQEAYFVMGWDEDRSCGLYLHVERFADTGQGELKVAVTVGDRVVSFSEHYPLTSALGCPGLDVTVDDPYRYLSLSLEAKGHEGDSTWLAEPGPGTVDLALDLELRSVLPPMDWSTVFAKLGMTSIEGDHYETGGVWAGTVTLGNETVEVEGLYIRDHSWGRRELSGYDVAWWTPMVFDEGRAYVSGASVLSAGQWHSYTLIEEGQGLQVIPDHLLRPTGTGGSRTYSGATIVAVPEGDAPLRFEADVRRHIPAEYPGFALSRPGYYMNDALCVVRWGDRHGFGVVEYNGYQGQTPDDGTPPVAWKP